MHLINMPACINCDTECVTAFYIIILMVQQNYFHLAKFLDTLAKPFFPYAWYIGVTGECYALISSFSDFFVGIVSSRIQRSETVTGIRIVATLFAFQGQRCDEMINESRARALNDTRSYATSDSR